MPLSITGASVASLFFLDASELHFWVARDFCRLGDVLEKFAAWRSKYHVPDLILMTPATARKKARKIQAMMAAGKDPMLERAKKKAVSVTLQDILEQYLAARNLKPNTNRSYRYMVARCLGDWLDLPVVSITREMVEQRHAELRKTTRQGTSGEAQANTVMHILGTLLNFAAANYEIDEKPSYFSIRSNDCRKTAAGILSAEGKRLSPITNCRTGIKLWWH